jgi:hypothetical protein
VRRERRTTALAALASSVLTVVIWTIAVMMILDQFGFALAPVLASAGIVGVAFGFGAQDLVKDFLSGVFILAEDQYGLGDTVDVGEASGVVEGVTLRSTRVRDVNGTLWHIPNGEIRRVGNQSQGWARSLLDVEVSYDTDLATPPGRSWPSPPPCPTRSRGTRCSSRNRRCGAWSGSARTRCRSDSSSRSSRVSSGGSHGSSDDGSKKSWTGSASRTRSNSAHCGFERQGAPEPLD